MAFIVLLAEGSASNKEACIKDLQKGKVLSADPHANQYSRKN